MKKTQPTLLFPLLLVTYEIINYLSNDMYLPALPNIMDDLNLSMGTVQLTLTSWFVGLACAPLVLGGFADAYGRKNILMITGIIYAFSSAICALSTNLNVLLVARFFEGSMVSGMFVAGYATIHELYDHKEAIRLLALMSSISVLAPALGPLFGSLLLLFTNWRGIFWFIAISAAIALCLLFKYMPETLPPEKRIPLRIRPLFKNYLSILKNKKFIRLSFVLGLIFCGFIVWIAASSLLVIDSFAHSAVYFGFIQVFIFMANILGNHTVRYWLEKIPINQIMQRSLIITLFGATVMGVLTSLFPSSLNAFLIGMIIYSFGSGLAFAPFNRMIIETSNEPMGMRVAIFTLFITGFAALGSALAGVIFNGSTISLSILIFMAMSLSYLIYKYTL